MFDFQGSLTGEMMDHHFLEPQSALYGPLLRLETWLDHRAPVVFTSSRHARRLLLEKFGCKPERVRSLPDCVNADFFRPASDFDRAKLTALRAQSRHTTGTQIDRLPGLVGRIPGHRSVARRPCSGSSPTVRMFICY